MSGVASGRRTTLSASLCAAIGDGDPIGEDPRSSAEFETARSEIAKSSGRDWSRAADAAREAVERRGKDITLLCYHVLAGTAARGWDDGAATVRALRILAKDHWKGIHPLREQGRRNAFAWLAEERTVGTFQQLPHALSDREAIAEFAADLELLRGFLSEVFPDSPPSLRPLQRHLEERLESLAKDAEGTAAPAPTGSAPRPDPPSAVATVPVPAAAPSASKGDLAQALQKIALAWTSTDPASATGYRLLRIGRWQELTSMQKGEGGRTAFAPPNPQRRAFLEGKHRERAWEAILERSEGAFTEPGLHLWLDLQRWLSDALDGVGRGACSEAVRSEVAGLLRRVPGIEEMRFSDGTPFADSATREWLEGLSERTGSPPPKSAAFREESLAQDSERARELAAQGRIADALELLQSGLGFGDRRARTERSLEIARIALQSGRVRVALSLSQELSELSERMDLGSWDPGMDRDVLDLRLRAIGAAMEAGVGDRSVLSREREDVARKAVASNPALLARFDF